MAEKLLLDRESNYPPVVQRYISKYRELKGLNARRNTVSSNKWFSDRITKDSWVKANKVHKELLAYASDKTSRSPIGRLYLFNYDPRWKHILPVYDTWPLVFMFNMVVGDGKTFGEKGVVYYFGLNVHYLPPKFRLMLFAELQKYKNDSSLREKSRLKLSWQIIKGFANLRLAKHAVKCYRLDHIRTEMAEIHPDTWEVIIPLQIAEWKKGGKAKAWELN